MYEELFYFSQLNESSSLRTGSALYSDVQWIMIDHNLVIFYCPTFSNMLPVCLKTLSDRCTAVLARVSAVSRALTSPLLHEDC